MVPEPPVAKREAMDRRTEISSDDRGLLAAHALWLVALDVVTVGFDLALRAVLAPAQVLDGDPGCGLFHVEAHARPQPDHRAPEQHVSEGLGQLVREVARGLEPGGEGLEVPRLPSRQRHIRGAALRRLAAQLLVDHVHRLSGEVAVGRQLSADDRDQTVHPWDALPDAAPLRPDPFAASVVVDDVASRDGALGALGLEGERADARVGEEHALAREVRLRDHEVRLVYEVLDLLFVRYDAVEVSVVADVGGPDEVESVPRHDEVRPPVLARLDVEGLVLRGAGDGVHDHVAALGAPDHAPLVYLPEHLVHPGTGHVEGDGRTRPVAAAAEDVRELDAGHAPIVKDEPVHLAVRQDDGAVLAGRDRVLYGNSLGILDLGVVVESRAEQALGVETRLALEGLFAAQHVVVVQALVQGG